jgi:predicted  nucleic acid-binding Zn-ribbon protein
VISDVVLGSCVGGSAALLASFVSNRISNRTRRDEVTIGKGKNELEGRRITMQEYALLMDGLQDELRRVHGELDRIHDEREKEQQIALQQKMQIADLRRDIAKEQRRSNILHEDFLRLKGQMTRLRKWLDDSSIPVPAEVLGTE